MGVFLDRSMPYSLSCDSRWDIYWDRELYMRANFEGGFKNAFLNLNRDIGVDLTSQYILIVTMIPEAELISHVTLPASLVMLHLSFGGAEGAKGRQMTLSEWMNLASARSRMPVAVERI